MKRTCGMRLSITVLVLLGVVAVIYMAIPNQLMLTITDEKTGEVVFAEPVRTGDLFSIMFIHSVHRTPVEEHFRVSSDQTMILEQVVYETYGVGNPSGPVDGETYRREEGRLIIDGMNRQMEAIHQRIGQVIADHTFMIDGRRYPFDAWSNPGSRVVLRIEKVSMWTVFAA
jgi:hypothetical protein